MDSALVFQTAIDSCRHELIRFEPRETRLTSIACSPVPPIDIEYPDTMVVLTLYIAKKLPTGNTPLFL